LEPDVTFRVVPKREEAFRVVTLVDERLEAEVTFRVVPKREEAFRVVTLVEERLAVDAVLSVVHCTNGIVRVEKLNTVLDAFDVNPAQTKLVVTTAFEA
jgi:hypothetical protein